MQSLNEDAPRVAGRRKKEQRQDSYASGLMHRLRRQRNYAAADASLKVSRPRLRAGEKNCGADRRT